MAGFITRFFAVAFIFFACHDALAQCCWCEVADDCDLGKYKVYNNCVPCSGPMGNVVCTHCCNDYTENCPGNDLTEYKCKVLQENCNSVSGCTRYKSCELATGNAGPDVVSGACHLENNTCYGNKRACEEFTLETENNDIDCQKASQQGQATWEPDVSAWDTSDCYCKIEHGVIGTGPFGIPFWCDDLNANYIVSPANMYRTTLVSANIIYTMERVYCAKCHPGYLPEYTDSPENGVYARPDNNGNWGVVWCPYQVTTPNYASGCVVQFNLPTGQDAVDVCKEPCPEGFETEENGATSINDCVSENIQYEDSTGTFVIPELSLCTPTP